MNRTRTWITVVAFLATFAWLLATDLKASLAVLWPSVLAVGLAFVTRDIYLSLFLGAFSGALLLHGGNPWAAFHDLLMGRLIPSLTDRWNISVLIFTLMMGGFAEVLTRNGSMTALSMRVMGQSRSPRRAGLGAYCMGWLVFFDGLASSVLVGKTLRPIADRAGLSREKLSFIVDSTSAPIAELALLSTWVAYEMSVIRQGLANTGDAALAEAVVPFSWLVLSLPFRFYNWFMLLRVFLLIWLMRDRGPMLEVERASRANRRTEPAVTAESAAGSHIALALVPLAVLVLGVFGGLYVGGGGLELTLTFPHLVQAMGKADAAGRFTYEPPAGVRWSDRDVQISEAFFNASSPASAHHAPTFRHGCCNNNVSDLPACLSSGRESELAAHRGTAAPWCSGPAIHHLRTLDEGRQPGRGVLRPAAMPITPEPDLNAARVEQIQGLLLTLSSRDLCEHIGLNWWAAAQLHLAGFLSFSPEAVEKMDERQEAELRFVGALVAAGCDHAMLTRLLAGLDKPYCYRPGRVYYDWAAQSWQLLPEPPDQPEEPDPDEVLSAWISSLQEDGDAGMLQHIKDQATAALTRLGSSPSS